MSTERDLVHAALQWHAAHARRLAIGTMKRRLDKEIKAEGFAIFSAAREQHATAARQVTELKRRELAALRVLAKVCAQQRGRFDTADVIDLDVDARLVTFAGIPDVTASIG
jgi:hypothetical protein